MGLSLYYYNEGTLGIFHLEDQHYQDAKKEWESIRASIKYDNLYAILIFDNSKRCLPEVEILDLEKWIKDLKLSYFTKIAIIESELPHKSRNSFGENAAYRRGLHNIKVFHNEVIAREWLGKFTR
jgi:hypothetical protein